MMQSNGGLTRRGGQRRRTTGNSILELSLVLPLLLAMAFGLVEFGQFFYVRHAFEAAARDAARVAVLSNATQSQVTSVLTSTLSQANVTYQTGWLTITDLGPNAAGTVTDISTVPMGDEIRLTVKATYSTLPNAVRPLFTMTGIGVGSNTTVSGVCTMVKE
jgi:Flp pilus assembly protein TadG